ncbi:CHC2 zinc finger domain-containing protein, partial [Lacticaseibacillus paracasei]
PSFSVNEPKQIFHCFSCGRGGNVFKFVMDYDNATFPEAVKKVADFAGMPLDVQVGHAAPVDPEISKQQHILQDTADLFHHILMN